MHEFLEHLEAEAPVVGGLDQVVLPRQFHQMRWDESCSPLAGQSQQNVESLVFCENGVAQHHCGVDFALEVALHDACDREVLDLAQGGQLLLPAGLQPLMGISKPSKWLALDGSRLHWGSCWFGLHALSI